MKQRIVVLLCIGLWIGMKSHAQRECILLHHEDLNYVSSFEKKQFDLFLNKDSLNYTAFFLAIDKDMDEQQYVIAESRINKIVEEFKPKFKKNNEKKTLEKLYKAVHNRILVKYESPILFPSIFKNGHFNCVTSSAVFGIILHKLNIPFVIQMVPNHVFVIAYPNTHNIALETTNPISGFKEFGKEYQDRYLSYLVNTKIIVESDIEEKGKTEIFVEYKFSKEQVGLKELIGLHYINQSYYLENEDKPMASFDAAEKAYIFYKQDRSFYSLLGMNTRIISLIEDYKTEDIKYISKLERYESVLFNPQRTIINEYKRMLHYFLTINNNEGACDMYFYQLLRELKSEEIKKELKYTHFAYKAEYFLRKLEKHKAKVCYDSVLFLKPNDIRSQNMFANILIAESYKFSFDKQFEIIEDYMAKHPSLRENKLLISSMLDTYLDKMYFAFKQGEVEKADLQMQAFETLLSKDEDIGFSLVKLENAYSMGAVYFFKRSNYRKARYYLQKGLDIFPESFSLKEKMKATY